MKVIQVGFIKNEWRKNKQQKAVTICDLSCGENFMTYLTSDSILILLGITIMKDILKWIVIGILYLTISLSIIHS
ncbi:hypothetical protein [Desulfosporosinus sp. SB140]|uniref:hypothetical protein n=1 Tax=Desulfosporosinus paludis TaxID=3115649 RepID=UPI0038905944